MDERRANESSIRENLKLRILDCCTLLASMARRGRIEFRTYQDQEAYFKKGSYGTETVYRISLYHLLLDDDARNLLKHKEFQLLLDAVDAYLETINMHSSIKASNREIYLMGQIAPTINKCMIADSGTRLRTKSELRKKVEVILSDIFEKRVRNTIYAPVFGLELPRGRVIKMGNYFISPFTKEDKKWAYMDRNWIPPTADWFSFIGRAHVKISNHVNIYNDDDAPEHDDAHQMATIADSLLLSMAILYGHRPYIPISIRQMRSSSIIPRAITPYHYIADAEGIDVRQQTGVGHKMLRLHQSKEKNVLSLVRRINPPESEHIRKLMPGIRKFSESLGERNKEKALVGFISTIEAMLFSEPKDSISFRLRLTLSLLDNEPQRDTEKIVNQLYKIRSKIVHQGAKISDCEKELRAIITTGGKKDAPTELAKNLAHIVIRQFVQSACDGRSKNCTSDTIEQAIMQTLKRSKFGR